MLVRYESALFPYLLALLGIQLFSSFGSLNGIELPLELLHVDGVNLPKSTDYARRLSFPLTSSDVVEMPLNVEDNLDFSSNGGGDANDMDMDDDLNSKTEIPKWFQMQLQQEQQHQQQHHHLQMDHKNYHGNMQQKNPKHKHHHSNRQQHSSSSSSAVSPLKRCSIEISSKIPGICQSMGSIGTACVSGDYIDVFNAECL